MHFTSTRSQLKSLKSEEKSVVNYQRSTPQPNPEYLEYRPQQLWIGRNIRNVNIFPCVISSEHEWYITYGFVNNFLYLVEPAVGETLRPTALIQTTAIHDEVLESNGNLLKSFGEQIEIKKNLGKITGS